MRKISIPAVLALIFLWLRGMELFVTHSTFFDLKELSLVGNGDLSWDEAINLAGVKLKQNIFGVSLEDISKRIEKDQRVKSAEVYRVLPGKIEIRIEEKKPDLILNLSPKLCGLSAEGEIIPLQEGRSYDLPLINGVKSKRLKPYFRVEDPQVEEALSFYKTVKEEAPWFLEKISEINLEDKDDLVVILVKGGSKIFFGAGDFQKKIERLIWISKSLVLEEFFCLDFRFKDQVIFKGVKKGL